MQNVFLELVKLSLIGSLFAAAVMLVRLVFRKAPKWLFCVLWGVVALRLICPVSIESSVSLVPDRLATGQILTNVGNEYVGDVDIFYESNAGYSNAIEAGRQPIYSNDGYYVVTEKDSLEAPKTVGQTVYPVLSWIWVAGMVLMLAYTAVSYLLLRRRMEEATHLIDNIWQCEQVDSPFVLGFIKPRIYLPYAITDSDMMNVIAHEQAHIQRKDHWWKPIGFLLLSIHWFNPVLWLAYILLCRDIEAACDEKVIKHMDKDEMRAYSTALLHCSVHRRRIAACPLAFGEVSVKERIKHVMNYKKPAFWIILAAILICTVVAVCFLTNPSAPSEFTMNGNNVHDLDVNTIIDRIQSVEELDDGNAYTNANNFHLIVDSDFNWVDSQTVRYFFYERKKTHSAQLRIFPEENKYFLTESTEWGEPKSIFLLQHYLDAIKYLPQEAIRAMAPADRYIVRQIEEGTPGNYSRVITYTPNGEEDSADWLIHLQVEPLHAAEEGYTGTGDEVIQLFYSDANDHVGDINKLLSLVSEIANNPDCASSSNPFTYIEAKETLYNEILTYGTAAVDFFVKQLRTGENGLQGYIMAVACADITGIGDKDLGADWATAQEWLALYDKEETAHNHTPDEKRQADSFIVHAEVSEITDYIICYQEPDGCITPVATMGNYEQPFMIHDNLIYYVERKGGCRLCAIDFAGNVHKEYQLEESLDRGWIVFSDDKYIYGAAESGLSPSASYIFQADWSLTECKQIDAYPKQFRQFDYEKVGKDFEELCQADISKIYVHGANVLFDANGMAYEMLLMVSAVSGTETISGNLLLKWYNQLPAYDTWDMNPWFNKVDEGYGSTEGLMTLDDFLTQLKAIEDTSVVPTNLPSGTKPFRLTYGTGTLEELPIAQDAVKVYIELTNGTPSTIAQPATTKDYFSIVSRNDSAIIGTLYVLVT